MSCSWCLTTLAQHHVFNPHSFEENPPTVCWVKNVKSKRGPDDVLAADYPTYCTSILQAAMLSFDWTTDPRLTPVGMLRVWPALTSRLPHAAPRLGSCNYVEAKRERASFQTHTHTPLRLICRHTETDIKGQRQIHKQRHTLMYNSDI